MDYDEGIKYLVNVDPIFASLYQRLGYLPQRRREPDFSDFVSTIVGQQLSGKAADKIFSRLSTLVSEKVSPDSLLKLSHQELVSVGISNSKAKYIRGISEKFASGDLEIGMLELLPTEELYDLLLKVPGLGPWSVNIILLFNFGRIDCYPLGDGTLSRAFDELYAPNGLELRQCLERWFPYGGVVAMYLWSYIDTK